jgi:hypothetical protein
MEASDTQEAATGAARQGPDMTGGHVGDSITQHGEDVVKEEGTEPGRYDLLPQGQSQRPAGGSTSRSLPASIRRKQSPRIPQRTKRAETPYPPGG